MSAALGMPTRCGPLLNAIATAHAIDRASRHYSMGVGTEFPEWLLSIREGMLVAPFTAVLRTTRPSSLPWPPAPWPA